MFLLYEIFSLVYLILQYPFTIFNMLSTNMQTTLDNVRYYIFHVSNSALFFI